MILKKSTLALCSSNNLQLPLWAPPPIPPSHPSSLPLRSSTPPGHSLRQLRQYAAVNHGDSQTNGRRANDLHSQWPSSTNPTPYEIFNQERGAPYNKALFYELVKIYHPDRHHQTSHDRIPLPTKIERYHLVVAANDILCDPARRRAYDLYGAGWGETLRTRAQYRRADRSWRKEPGNAANNATWEDWEQWYQARDGKKQEPVYMSHGAFVTTLALFVLLGGWGQITRAEYRSLSDIELRDQTSEQISKEMRRRRSEAAILDRNERVQSFLRQREGWGYSTGHVPQHPTHDDKSR